MNKEGVRRAIYLTMLALSVCLMIGNLLIGAGLLPWLVGRLSGSGAITVAQGEVWLSCAWLFYMLSGFSAAGVVCFAALFMEARTTFEVSTPQHDEEEGGAHGPRTATPHHTSDEDVTVAPETPGSRGVLGNARVWVYDFFGRSKTVKIPSFHDEVTRELYITNLAQEGRLLQILANYTALSRHDDEGVRRAVHGALAGLIYRTLFAGGATTSVVSLAGLGAALNFVLGGLGLDVNRRTLDETKKQSRLMADQNKLTRESVDITEKNLKATIDSIKSTQDTFILSKKAELLKSLSETRPCDRVDDAKMASCVWAEKSCRYVMYSYCPANKSKVKYGFEKEKGSEFSELCANDLADFVSRALDMKMPSFGSFRYRSEMLSFNHSQVEQCIASVRKCKLSVGSTKTCYKHTPLQRGWSVKELFRYDSKKSGVFEKKDSFLISDIEVYSQTMNSSWCRALNSHGRRIDQTNAVLKSWFSYSLLGRMTKLKDVFWNIPSLFQENVNFERMMMTGMRFSKLYFKVGWSLVMMSDSKFEHVFWDDVIFSNVGFERVDLVGGGFKNVRFETSSFFGGGTVLRTRFKNLKTKDSSFYCGKLSWVDVDGFSFEGDDYLGVALDNSNFFRGVLNGGYYRESIFVKVYFRYVIFSHLFLDEILFRKSVFEGVQFKDARFMDVSLRGVDVVIADFVGVDFLCRMSRRRCVGFEDVMFYETIFDDVVFDNMSFVRVLFKGGVMTPEMSFKNVSFSRVDFEGVGFEDVVFDGLSFFDFKIDETVFNGGRWVDVVFDGGFLRDVVFDKLALNVVVFGDVHLERVVFNALLDGVDFRTSTFARSSINAQLIKRVDFRGVDLSDVMFENADKLDLSAVCWDERTIWPEGVNTNGPRVSLGCLDRR